MCTWSSWVCYLLVDLLCGLSVTEGHGCYVFQDGHLHSAVAPVQQRHQRARMHRPVHNGWPDAYTHTHTQKNRKERKSVRWAEQKWRRRRHEQKIVFIVRGSVELHIISIISYWCDEPMRPARCDWLNMYLLTPTTSDLYTLTHPLLHFALCSQDLPLCTKIGPLGFQFELQKKKLEKHLMVNRKSVSKLWCWLCLQQTVGEIIIILFLFQISLAKLGFV